MSEHLTLQTPSERGWIARLGPECGHLEQPLILARGGNINNSYYFQTNFTFPRVIKNPQILFCSLFRLSDTCMQCSPQQPDLVDCPAVDLIIALSKHKVMTGGRHLSQVPLCDKTKNCLGDLICYITKLQEFHVLN